MISKLCFTFSLVVIFFSFCGEYKPTNNIPFYGPDTIEETITISELRSIVDIDSYKCSEDPEYLYYPFFVFGYINEVNIFPNDNRLALYEEKFLNNSLTVKVVENSDTIFYKIQNQFEQQESRWLEVVVYGKLGIFYTYLPSNCKSININISDIWIND